MRKKRIGQDIQKTIEIVRSHKLDIDAKVTVRYLSSGEKKVKNTLDFRFIAVYNERTDEYHTHFTNIPEEELDGRDVASLYAARWDIENLFRETKSENLLGRLKSKNDVITEIFIRIQTQDIRCKNKSAKIFPFLFYNCMIKIYSSIILLMI